MRKPVTQRRPGTIEKAMKVFAYVCDFKQTNDGTSPNLREIGEACSISSTSVVEEYLEVLAEIGKIERPANMSRFIIVVGGQWLPPGEQHDQG